jgi:diguanylate cyclase (GGDEF)-like protein/PAS domain S-box-containing protein
MPTGGGLRDEDWIYRHTLLTWTMVVSGVLLTAIGAVRGELDLEWLISITLISLFTFAALFLPPRRLPSVAVSLGLTAVCAECVMMFDGLTEAHFTFFIAVGALALYRDWVPFGAFLAATVAHHAVLGTLMAHRAFDHQSAYEHPWFWALVHGLAVLLAAVTQVIGWRLTEGDEQRASEDLTQAEAQFTAAFEEAPIAMSMMSADGHILRANPAFQTWMGLPAHLPANFSTDDLPVKRSTPDKPIPMFSEMREQGVDVVRGEHTFVHNDGRVIVVDMHASALRDATGRLRLIVSHFLDITEKRANEAALLRQAREDSLTGLLGRGAFESELATLVHLNYGQVAVIYVDVDRFKAVNDSYGHAVGDEVLRELGRRLHALAPADALVARLGGDEFAIALPGPASRAEDLGTAIVASCDREFMIPGGHLNVTASVGVSAASAGEDAEATMQSADMAMYAAKQGGRDRIKLFDDTMRLNKERRVAAEHSLREALDGDRVWSLPVWFQPIISLKTRQLIGAEALVRLRVPEGELVPPGVFIPIAEETGMVVPLGQHVLHTALGYLRTWGERLPYVSVNVSPRQLSEAGFVPMLTAELAASGLEDPSRLVLEITETSLLLSSVELKRRLDAIKALGVRLALDDFGTGYSSLTWLQSVPADIVKLDRSFVAGLANDADKAAIISAVLWLAKSLGMSVIAEGVEEVEDAEMLARANCPAAQGYLFSRPLDPPGLERLLPEIASRQPASSQPASGELGPGEAAGSGVAAPRSSSADEFETKDQDGGQGREGFASAGRRYRS